MGIYSTHFNHSSSCENPILAREVMYISIQSHRILFQVNSKQELAQKLQVELERLQREISEQLSVVEAADATWECESDAAERIVLVEQLLGIVCVVIGLRRKR